MRTRATIAALAALLALPAAAHHSFAMYDVKQVHVITGIVTRVDPNPNHLQVFFVPLNEARDQIINRIGAHVADGFFE